MTMHKALHPRDDIDRLYVTRKEGGRAIIINEDCVDALIRLEKYIKNSNERLVTAASNSNGYLMEQTEKP